MRILVLGASGMLGHAVVRMLATNHDAYQVIAVSRSVNLHNYFGELSNIEFLTGLDAENTDALLGLFARVRPDWVINCIGVVKQHIDAANPLAVLPINAMLPHRLAHICNIISARLIHISTDCVFQGTRGNYNEEDLSDATDLYGISKYIGEVSGQNSVILRTSIIGHEIQSSRGLIEWFLAQEGPVHGYRRSIFSGLPTIELANIIKKYIIPRQDLFGVFHIASAPISKFDLLTLVAKTYGRDIVIEPDDTVNIDRSLDGSRFREATGYEAPTWPDLVALMHAHRL